MDNSIGAPSFRYQDFMTSKDWVMLITLGVISSLLWGWVYAAYQKPIIDPSLLMNDVSPRVEGASTTGTPIINHAPEL